MRKNNSQVIQMQTTERGFTLQAAGRLTSAVVSLHGGGNVFYDLIPFEGRSNDNLL
jgi:hypothetical protein